jgi:VWFA-related protein
VAQQPQQVDEVRVSAHAYTPPEDRLSTQVQLVQVGVVVRDPRGRAVSGLKRADFEILDDGKPRAIAAFSVETHGLAQAAASAGGPATTASSGGPLPAPRYTLLFFDDLHGTSGELQHTQAAARRFIQDGLGPGARAAVFSASEGLTLDFTADPAALTAAIEKLRSHTRLPESGLMPCPRIAPYQAYLIANGLDNCALTAAVLEAQACSGSFATPTPVTPSMPSVLLCNGARISVVDPIFTAVKSQAELTWQQTNEISLNSFDALANAVARLARVPGTRVLLMASTGFVSGNMEGERADAIDRAIHAGIVINALDAKGLWSEPPVRPFDEGIPQTAALPAQAFMFEASSNGARIDALNTVMAEFTAGTGGLFFHNGNDLAAGFAQLAAVPETTYLLAFRPDDRAAAGTYHKLKVRLTAKNGDYVQARPGYFTPSNAPVEATAARRKFDSEALAADTMADFPVQLAGRLSKTEKGDPVLSLVIHVDIDKLDFAERDGRQIQRLAFLGALMDARGKLVTAKEGAMELALKEGNLVWLSAIGVNATLTLGAPPGPYRVRVVVQEAGGKMAALNQVVDIPK